MDRIAATLAVIEAAKEWNTELTGPVRSGMTERNLANKDRLQRAVDALADATSPDLDAKIAQVLPCDGDCDRWPEGTVEHDVYCSAFKRPAVRDLIYAMLADYYMKEVWPLAETQMRELQKRSQLMSAAHAAGYAQAKEQAAQIVIRHGVTGGRIIAEAICIMTPEGTDEK